MPYISYIGPGDWWQVETHGHVFTGTYSQVFFWHKYANQIDQQFVRDFAANV